MSWDVLARAGGIAFATVMCTSTLFMLFIIVKETSQKLAQKNNDKKFFKVVEECRSDFDGSGKEI